MLLAAAVVAGAFGAAGHRARAHAAARSASPRPRCASRRLRSTPCCSSSPTRRSAADRRSRSPSTRRRLRWRSQCSSWASRCRCCSLSGGLAWRVHEAPGAPAPARPARRDPAAARSTPRRSRCAWRSARSRSAIRASAAPSGHDPWGPLLIALNSIGSAVGGLRLRRPAPAATAAARSCRSRWRCLPCRSCAHLPVANPWVLAPLAFVAGTLIAPSMTMVSLLVSRFAPPRAARPRRSRGRRPRSSPAWARACRSRGVLVERHGANGAFALAAAGAFVGARARAGATTAARLTRSARAARSSAPCRRCSSAARRRTRRPRPLEARDLARGKRVERSLEALARASASAQRDARDDARDDLLAPFRHGGARSPRPRRTSGCAQQRLLDLARVDVRAAADDQVLASGP